LTELRNTSEIAAPVRAFRRSGSVIATMPAMSPAHFGQVGVEQRERRGLRVDLALDFGFAALKGIEPLL
jgi:hypothetical protein